MKRIVLVDGENFKAKINAVFRAAGKTRPKWHQYDFKSLFTQVFNGITIDQFYFYFARIKEHPQTRTKSKQLIEEQRLLKTHLEKQGFQIILQGRVRGQFEADGRLVFKEKGVDVKIAVDMVSLSCDKKTDEILLLSSDSDLQPAITEVKKRDVKCVYVGFENQPNRGMSYTADRTILIRDTEVLR